MNYKGIKHKKFKCIFCNNNFNFRGYTYKHKYCNNKCQGAHRTQLKNEKLKSLFSKGKLSERRDLYPLLVEAYGNQCSICKITHWNNKFIRFWVDYIDGNPQNNNPNNLRLICPNCDSQSETFGGRNLGNGRKSRGLPLNY